MIMDTLKTDTTFIVEVKNLTKNRVEKGLGFLKYNEEFSIYVNEKKYKIDILDKAKLDEIEYFLINRGYTAMINVIESIRDLYFTMEIIFFSYHIKEIFDNFYIELDEKILLTAKQKNFIKKQESMKELLKVFQEKISFKINGAYYFLVSNGSSSKDDIFKDNIKELSKKIKEKEKRINDEENKVLEEQNNDEIEKLKEQIKKIEIQIISIEEEKNNLDFTIYGENLYLPVKKSIRKDGDYEFKATKLITFKDNIKKDSLRLVKANILFKNGLMSERIAKDLGDIIESDDSYLNSWDKYLELEGNILLKKAKDIGVLEQHDIEIVENGLRIKIINLPEDLINEGEYISFVDDIPNYINDNLTFSEHFAQMEQKEVNTVSKKSKEKSYEIKNISQGFISIETDENLNKFKNKKLVLSIYGDETQLKRKLQARQRLSTGKSANPHLGLIIEDTDKIKSYLNLQTRKKIDAISPNIKNKIFPKNDPTLNQIEAISIALNTPDIAIIQGPPGTGKTTILNAIIERLNELSDKSGENRGQILVAGFQHDAVENIIGRLDINGLPTPKFGKKSTKLIDEYSYERIQKWAEEIVNDVKIKKPELDKYKHKDKLQKTYEVYLKTPSNKMAIYLLKYIKNELTIDLKKEIIEKCDSLIDILDEKKVEDISNLKHIYALRTTKESFLDDGIERNQDLLFSSIGSILIDEEKMILQDDNFINSDEYLKKLSKLKFTLIDRLYPKPIFKSEKPNQDILEFMEEVEKELKIGKNQEDKINYILSNYLNELENNPFELKSILEDYSYVFSATTGQSYKAAKEKKNNKDEYMSFDTVIVDEAARVAPMDLLIVMVLAKRRIILVGDHRQLPHMIDDDIVQNSELNEDKYIKESMFGYLKDRAIRLKEFDGIRREITLENQYRTHPLLGKFISDNFYKKYNEQFNSPLGNIIGNIDNFFLQKLKGIENIPAVWINIPNRYEETEPRSRVSEAKAIMIKLKEWIFSSEGNELDFGIITFYQDQVKAIEKELKNTFTKKDIDGFKDRLKIGTVDSFQGMEFDIVFLSTVKSRSLKSIKDDMKDYQLFGFVTSKSRLCVSMSRQKRSLIVVGDKEFFDTNRAKNDVEGLHNFLQLCKTKGIVI